MCLEWLLTVILFITFTSYNSVTHSSIYLIPNSVIRLQKSNKICVKSNVQLNMIKAGWKKRKFKNKKFLLDLSCTDNGAYGTENLLNNLREFSLKLLIYDLSEGYSKAKIPS